MKKTPEQLKQEIIDIEALFAKTAQEQGVEKAFLMFSAEDAVLSRNNQLIKGKSAIRKYFSESKYSDVRLIWKPDFTDVSNSGDLAYTYGSYTFSAVDKDGKPISDEGIFHTVWKRQADGSWKFVWD